MQPDIIHQTITNYFVATQSANKAEAMLACCTEDVVSYDPVGSSGHHGKEQVYEFIQGIAGLFKEVGLTAEFTSIHGDEAAVKWTGRGVGLNGRNVTFEGIDIFEFDQAGQIKTIRAYWNPETLMTKLQ